MTTHGSSAPEHLEDAPARWIESGLATVALRVRGYPPSTHDTDDLREDWILRDIEDAESWIVRGAVVAHTGMATFAEAGVSEKE